MNGSGNDNTSNTDPDPNMITTTPIHILWDWILILPCCRQYGGVQQSRGSRLLQVLPVSELIECSHKRRFYKSKLSATKIPNITSIIKSTLKQMQYIFAVNFWTLSTYIHRCIVYIFIWFIKINWDTGILSDPDPIISVGLHPVYFLEGLTMIPFLGLPDNGSDLFVRVLDPDPVMLTPDPQLYFQHILDNTCFSLNARK